MNVNKHPYLDLYIANYTPECAYSRAWDDVTLKCRGLVFNGSGEIIAQPFPKFFNLEELERTGESLPSGPFDVYEKMDGSLGILFTYDGVQVLATRGSFVSDQARRGMQILLAKHGPLDWVAPNVVYMFEIIYPENRIVLSYGDEEELYFLGATSKWHGEDYIFMSWDKYPGPSALHLGQHTLKELPRLKKYLSSESEGFVLRWPNGFRVKVKGEDYVRLHRIMTGITERRVWEKRSETYYFREEEFQDWLKDVPEEFETWIRATVEKLSKQFHDIVKQCDEEHARVYELIHEMEYYPDSSMKMPFLDEDRKKYAAAIKDFEHRDVLFRRLDGKSDWWRLIWKKLRPAHILPYLETTEEE